MTSSVFSTLRKILFALNQLFKCFILWHPNLGTLSKKLSSHLADLGLGESVKK